MLSLLRLWRRRRWAEQPVPQAWRDVVERRMPFVARYTATQQRRFWAHVRVFIEEKDWVGVSGLVVTDEMKVCVAGMAARMALPRSAHLYDALGTVILHPGALERSDDGVILGRAFPLGAIALSWNAVQHGLASPSDGHNVVIHELAHVLDGVGGDFDGTPPLDVPADARAWARAFSSAYARLRAGRLPVLRDYGATNEAEFFAVASEAFFERPHALQKKDAALHAALARYYGDGERPPSAWRRFVDSLWLPA